MPYGKWNVQVTWSGWSCPTIFKLFDDLLLGLKTSLYNQVLHT